MKGDQDDTQSINQIKNYLGRVQEKMMNSFFSVVYSLLHEFEPSMAKIRIFYVIEFL